MPPKQIGRTLLFQCINILNCVFLILCLLINALDVASLLVMHNIIVFLYLQLHSGERGRLALLYLQFV